MRTIKKWLYKWLPKASKTVLLHELDARDKQIQTLKEENGQLRAYIAGLEYGVRRHNKIIINGGQVNGNSEK